MAKISTIIAVYNVQDYLEECLQCLLDQTYSVHEIIAVDDGSTDSSGEMLDRWAKKHKEIRVIHQENTGGPGAPRNRGLEVATGDHIHFMDPDDLLSPNYYEAMAESIQKSDPEIVVSAMLKFNSRKSWSPPTFRKLSLFSRNRSTTLLKFPDLIQNLSSTNKVFKKRFLEENDLYFLEGGASEEIHFTSCCLYSAKEIYINKEATYYWRRREGGDNPSVTQQKAEFKSVLDRLNSHKTIDRYLEDHQLIKHRYVKDARAILDFTRHGNLLFEFDPEDRERFFEEVNGYLDTIDPKAYKYVPHYAKKYYLSRLFFLRNRLEYELVASGKKEFGVLPAYTEKKGGTPQVFFDLSYLKKEFGKDPLFYDHLGVPGAHVAGRAYLQKGVFGDDTLTLEGHGYIDYLNVDSRDQVEMEVSLRKRGSEDEVHYPVTLRPSVEMSDVIRHNYSKFFTEIPLEGKITEWLSGKKTIDIRLAVSIDGFHETPRLSSLGEDHFLPETVLWNTSSKGELYTTNKGNISIKP
ncbi:MAG TPA: glycosyltransferase [Bacillales bacterium]|nr:glycosyltransferase [Bacillales bacterium]